MEDYRGIYTEQINKITMQLQKMIFMFFTAILTPQMTVGLNITQTDSFQLLSSL